MDKECCHAMPVIERATGNRCKLCTYFSNIDNDGYICDNIYDDKCQGYYSREEWKNDFKEK